METHRLLRRIGTALMLTMAVSACALRSTLPPAPFPRPSSPAATRPEWPSHPSPAGAAAVLRTALRLKGVPYRWGGDDPRTGFDCSGFVQYVLAQHRIAAPRTSAGQFLIGTGIGIRQVRAGDLVFFSTVAPGPSHVGLAISNEEFVHAPASSGVVRVERVHAPYWRERYVGARRLF